jgi:MFS transporter, DHA1 family, inner membrane transport protein
VNWVGGFISGAGFLLALVSLWLDRISPAQPFEAQPVRIAHHH